MKRICAIAMAVTAALMARAQTEPVGGGAQPPVWETATVVNAWMFKGHEDLKELKLTRVTEIGHEAFYHLTNLEKIHITTDPESAGGLFQDYGAIFGWSDNLLFPKSETYNANLTSVELGVPFVSNWGISTMDAFPYFTYMKCTPKYIAYNSPKLETVVLPEGINVIREYSFCGSDVLRSVRIPALVSEIQKGAFADCPNILDVVCESGMPPIIRNETFGPNRQNITLHVPRGFRDVYVADPQWGRFGTIVEDEDITCSYTPDMLPTRNTTPFEMYWHVAQFYKCFKYAVYDEDAGVAAVTPLLTYISGFEDDGYPLYASVAVYDHAPNYYCSLMWASKTVTIEEKEYQVCAIGNHAFSNKYMLLVEIPANIEHIGNGAYYNSRVLQTVRVHRAEPPTMGDDRVFGDKSALTLEVPVGAAAAYRAAEVWRDFGNIVENAELGSSGVVSIDTDIPAGPDAYYSIDGRQLTGRPAPGTIHIVRHADGSATLRR